MASEKSKNEFWNRFRPSRVNKWPRSVNTTGTAFLGCFFETTSVMDGNASKNANKLVWVALKIVPPKTDY